jgi:flagellar export protein FliJ
MSFHFPLAAVLVVRENARKREEQALQKIQLEVASIAKQIEEFDAELAQVHNVREKALQAPIPAADLHSLQHRLQSLAEARKTSVQRLQVLERERDHQIELYQAAYRDHETIVDMLNEQRDAHEQAQSRSEQRNLDDIFVARRQRS